MKGTVAPSSSSRATASTPGRGSFSSRAIVWFSAGEAEVMGLTNARATIVLCPSPILPPSSTPA